MRMLQINVFLKLPSNYKVLLISSLGEPLINTENAFSDYFKEKHYFSWSHEKIFSSLILLRIASILFQDTFSGSGDSNTRGDFIIYINFVIFTYILEELG